MKALAASGEKGLLQIMAATHAGMTIDEFSKTVAEWTISARHPRFNRPYTELVYQPMLELLAYLRASGFKTFVVSGDGVEFMRPWMEKDYGIPPEHVVGSSGVVKFQIGAHGKPELLKLAKLEFVDDGPGKPVGIRRGQALHDGYFQKNESDAYTLNNITAKKNTDGSVTVQFGGCDGKVPNCLPVVKGWNYTVRLYRPRDEILNGKWKFPEPQPVT